MFQAAYHRGMGHTAPATRLGQDRLRTDPARFTNAREMVAPGLGCEPVALRLGTRMPSGRACTVQKAGRGRTRMASMNDDLCFTPATELARMFADRSVSPVEVMDAVLARLEALNPRLNAVCTPTPDSAMAAARRSEEEMMSGAPLGPLHGVPTTIKDLVFTRGVRTGGGSHVYADRVPDVDAPVVTRLREAGAISIGKTAVPELGWKGCGDSPLTGTSHNPLDARHERGGLEHRRRYLRGGGHRSHPPGIRWRRLHSHPGRVLRNLRDQAIIWTGAELSRAEQTTPSPTWDR